MDNQVKKSKVGIIILITVLVILIIGGTVGGVLYYRWANRPYVKAMQAYDEEDYEAVVALYPVIKKEEEQLEVYNLLLDLVRDTDKDYYKERIDYDEALDICKLTREILKKDDDYKDAVEHLDSIHDSRESFGKAEELFGAEEYEAAMEQYTCVIEEDGKYYELAQAQIEVCKELLNTFIDGDYSVLVDLRPLICAQLQYSGFEYDFDSTNISYPFNVCIELNEDGTGRVFLDMDSFYNGHDIFIDSLSDFAYKYAEQEYGYSSFQIDIYITMMGYDSLLDYVLEDAGDFMDLMDADRLLDMFLDGETEYSFYYKYVNNQLYMGVTDSILTMSEDQLEANVRIGNLNKMEVEVNEDFLTIDFSNYAVLYASLPLGSLTNPVVFSAN